MTKSKKDGWRSKPVAATVVGVGVQKVVGGREMCTKEQKWKPSNEGRLDLLDLLLLVFAYRFIRF